MLKRNSIVLLIKKRENITKSKEIWRKSLLLGLAGGVAFWVATFAISRTPVAAEYRSALSIAYIPMLFQALIGGLIVGFCVSYFLLRFCDKIPTKNPIPKSVILSFVALFIASILVQIAASQTNAVMKVFLIGTMLNVPRFLALGIVIGYLYDKLHGGT